MSRCWKARDPPSGIASGGGGAESISCPEGDRSIPAPAYPPPAAALPGGTSAPPPGAKPMPPGAPSPPPAASCFWRKATISRSSRI